MASKLAQPLSRFFVEHDVFTLHAALPVRGLLASNSVSTATLRRVLNFDWHVASGGAPSKHQRSVLLVFGAADCTIHTIQTAARTFDSAPQQSGSIPAQGAEHTLLHPMRQG
ncbi:hypothetical protein [Tahibacter sp.]|uniref:hypothetical protein n=1 Tax=Tahibacter sp. TaxID=2056211 RepID=UPI0028C42D7B|nr:hypothetical protein [Tahibacter sp.]